MSVPGDWLKPPISSRSCMTYWRSDTTILNPCKVNSRSWGLENLAALYNSSQRPKTRCLTLCQMIEARITWNSHSCMDTDSPSHENCMLCLSDTCLSHIYHAQGWEEDQKMWICVYRSSLIVHASLAFLELYYLLDESSVLVQAGDNEVVHLYNKDNQYAAACGSREISHSGIRWEYSWLCSRLRRLSDRHGEYVMYLGFCNWIEGLPKLLNTVLEESICGQRNWPVFFAMPLTSRCLWYTLQASLVLW